MFVKPKALIGGIYGSGRMPGYLGKELLAVMAPPLKRPTTADKLFREVGGSRDLYWSLLGVSLAFDPRVPRGRVEIGGISPIKIKFESKRFPNCEAAENHLNLLASEKRRIAKALMKFTDTKLLNERKEKIDRGEFRHKADVFIAVDLGKHEYRQPCN